MTTIKKLTVGVAIASVLAATGWAVTRDTVTTCDDLLKNPSTASAYSASYGQYALSECKLSCPERQLTFSYDGHLTFGSETWNGGVPVCEKK